MSIDRRTVLAAGGAGAAGLALSACGGGSQTAQDDQVSEITIVSGNNPWIQGVQKLTYGEVQTNLLAEDFLPLNVQRMQLSVYGMENFVPQSTDWLRVTLFVGAPRLSDLAEGTVDDDWIFVSAPGAVAMEDAR